MKISKILIALIIIAAGLFASYYVYSQKNIVKNTESMTKSYADQLKHNALPFSGVFRWTFFLGPAQQISTHIFTPKYIDYRMTGQVHSTDYRIQQLSYNNSNKKWIGETPDGIVYALFFKNINDKTITIYKHKCKHGLSEALALQHPADDITADHGWNVYTREAVVENTDKLAFEGIFYNNKNQAFELHDDKATWKNQTYQKFTHHFGERRWVGKIDNRYLVIFYDLEKSASQGKFAILLVDDVKEAYKLKHEEQIFTLYQRK